MKTDMSTVYGALLLDMLHTTQGDGAPYALGEGYAITFVDRDDVANGYIVTRNGVHMVEGSDVLYVDAHKPHTLAIARLLYAQYDIIVSRYLAHVDSMRKIAEKQLAKEVSR